MRKKLSLFITIAFLVSLTYPFRLHTASAAFSGPGSDPGTTHTWKYVKTYYSDTKPDVTAKEFAGQVLSMMPGLADPFLGIITSALYNSIHDKSKPIYFKIKVYKDGDGCANYWKFVTYKYKDSKRTKSLGTDTVQLKLPKDYCGFPGYK